MTEKFKAIIIDNQNEKFTREIKEIDTSHLKDGNVLVKVDYSSLNFKDALILNDGGRIVRKFPFVPGIDFAGIVVESEDNKFKKDDKVILTGFRVGEAYFGGFAQYAKVDSNFLIKIPKDLDSHKAMMLGTAGFTALLCSFAVKAKEELLMGEKIKDVLIELDNDNMDNTHVLFYENLNKDEHYNYIDRLCNNYINTNNKETRHIIHLKNDFCTLKLRLNLTRINETDFKISATLPEFKYIF